MLFERNGAIAEWRECRIARPVGMRPNTMLKYLHRSEHVEKIHEFSLRVRHFAEKEQVPYRARYDGYFWGFWIGRFCLTLCQAITDTASSAV